MPADLTLDAFVRFTQLAIDVYYEADNPAGGSLHIVLDDGGIEDRNVEFCIEYADKYGDAMGKALGELLLALPFEARARAVSREACACGHSRLLHADRVEGNTTWAEQGACEVDDCPCERFPLVVE